ncbi:MAG: RNA-binding transcriptional accessory protein [Waddliaceae bacterium]|nr:RNA-binding transcriptional accessory protein [Waddliaceae bacterium]
MSFDPIAQIAQELHLSNEQVKAVVLLLDDGNTIPFVARYRKEATGNLDEVQIRLIEERLKYLRELQDRKETIIESIESQGKLTDALKKKILECESKNTLEDLYLPYKPKRRTRAQIAKEKGLEPLAQIILAQPLEGDPELEAQAYISEEKELSDIAAVLKGARDIVAEHISEQVDLRAYVRECFQNEGRVVSKVRKGIEEKTKFEQYYDFDEAVNKIPSHRYLAIRRGEREKVLRMHVEVDDESVVAELLRRSDYHSESPFAQQFKQALEDGYSRLVQPSVESDVCVDLKMESDRAAVDIFAENLRTVMMGAPLGGKTVIGIDPGLRTGCKCAVVLETGKFLATETLYLSRGAAGEAKAAADFAKLVKTHRPFAIAVGNGTGGRETETFVRDQLKLLEKTDIVVVQVSESGASVYSASDIAREEFPDLDLTIRGAISIARRLQDPLSELVKVEPKSLGVGQYQHDVYQPLLDGKLHEVVESCVNQVGVELNTASAPLLSYVAGIGDSLAKKIVAYRESNGAFHNRKELLKVPGLGAKTFEQSAGFLRLHQSDNPLDASAVHPERYDIVMKMAGELGVALGDLIGSRDLVKKIDCERYMSDDLGLLTLQDIVEELQKPGRDPRDAFEMPCFREDIREMSDLRLDMVLEGIVTNVTAFGAFVDLGVHQDGLIHVSELSDKFVKDPSQVVKAGQKIRVRVLEVDLDRKRIALSARMGGEVRSNPSQSPSKAKTERNRLVKSNREKKEKFAHNPFDLL